MTIQFYQDYQNGVCNYRLDTRLATAGATKLVPIYNIKLILLIFFLLLLLCRVSLPTLEPQGKAQHVCNVVFFTPGLYKIDIQCSAPDNYTLTPTGHVWKFIPAVEINVT